MSEFFTTPNILSDFLHISLKSFGENLTQLREAKGETQTEAALALGLSRSTYANYEAGLNSPKIDVIMQILGHFGVSFEQLTSTKAPDVHLNEMGDDGGNTYNVLPKVLPSVHPKAQKWPDEPGIHQGMPAVVTVDQAGRDNVVYVPVKARAGYLLGYGDTEFISSLPAYSVPGLNHGTYRAFEVDGNSMFNSLHDHDIVIGRWATDVDFRDDRVFIIVTKNDGILVKRCIFRDGKIIAKSDNNHRGEYPTIVLELAEVTEIWYVVQRWTRQLSQPGELYKRVIELEAKFALLEGRLNGT